ncbi:hypothetical protein SAMN05443999_1081 [Roseovarius azorensis]|uniref:AAA+ family ATPase n=1 Tax=Roseovarius azorensis TaxID=1287727 RepID=A0A1H7SY46_9RHOB|nr:hypothetical protein [Roseovarius azorensis]SEL77531.1 hypothetical protein SAMN05443999_1081 [Roseovarius azorensis]
MIPRYLILTATVLAVLGAEPAAAQDTSEEDEGRSLIEDGARLLFEGLRDRAGEMEPALRDFVEQMGPALRDLMDKVGDLSAYHPPEVLPNGDIIIRRKTPQELEAERLPEGEIEI